MKKLAIILAIVFSSTILFSTASLFQTRAVNDKVSVFAFPASLEIIGDEAFEGTAAENVIFPYSLIRIGERVFAGNFALRTISIPESVEHIGDRAFEETSDLTIYGAQNSYAASWASMHGIAFVEENTTQIWMKKIEKLINVDFCIVLTSVCIYPKFALLRRRNKQNLWRSLRPQDRPELYPIEYRFP